MELAIGPVSVGYEAVTTSGVGGAVRRSSMDLNRTMLLTALT
jgi:hypothetical protein